MKIMNQPKYSLYALNVPFSPRSRKVRKFPFDRGGVAFCKASRLCSCKLRRFRRAMKNVLAFTRTSQIFKMIF